jgi:TolA-binding protein
MRMKVTLGIAAWLVFALAAQADIQDAPDTNVAPVAQPVGPDTGPQVTPPRAQPVNPGDQTTPSATPVAPPAAATSARSDDNTPSPALSSDASATGQSSDTGDNGTAPAAPPAGPGLTVVPLAQVKFQAATAAYNAGHYAEAVREFTDFVHTFPTDRRMEEALFHLAESYRELGRTSDAFAAYTYQVGRFTDGPFRCNAELQRGAILFDQGKLADAVAPLQYAFDHGEGVLKEDAEFLLARAFLATQKEPAGRALLQGIIDAQPPGKLAGNAAQVLAELDDTQGKSADALALWQKAAALLPNWSAQATAATRGGWSALTANQPDVAQKLFEEARTLGASGPVLQVANTGLLRVLFAQKKYADWLKLDAATQDQVLASSHAEILYDRGHANFALKQWTGAVTAFDAFLKEFGADPAAPSAAYERMLAAIQADPTKTITEADDYLKAYPQSPYHARVQLLEAQEYSRAGHFADASPIWEKLAAEPAAPDWPRREILLERARAYDELQQWPQAATAYRALIDEGNLPPATLLTAEARLAVCLQNDNQSTAATEAWKAVQAQAPAGSPDQQVALESLALIYARGGPSQEALAAQTFRDLLDKFPQTKLKALAAFSVGDYMFQQRDYAGAEPFLIQARMTDAATWNQPVTERLALGAYGRKDWAKALSYTREYDLMPGAEAAGPLPAPLFYALAQEAQATNDLPTAEDYYRRVTVMPGAGELTAGAWWQLGQVQAARKEYASAVTSYQQYEQLKPEAKNANSVLLAVGRAQLGAQQLDAAKATANQALLQAPEGSDSAAARMLLAEVAYAAQSYAEAARMFATLALLFDKTDTEPQAMARAADSFDKAGDAKSAADWRAKLQAKYPQFVPVPYY